MGNHVKALLSKMITTMLISKFNAINQSQKQVIMTPTPFTKMIGKQLMMNTTMINKSFEQRLKFLILDKKKLIKQ